MAPSSPINSDSVCLPVSARGYECTVHPRGELRITDLAEVGAVGRTYRPFDHPALYARFAGLGTEPSSLLKFANEFGFLEQGQRRNGIAQHLSEPVDFWIRRISELRAAVEFHKLLQTNQIKKLAEFVKLEAIHPPVPITLDRTFRHSSRPRNKVPLLVILDPFDPQQEVYWMSPSKDDLAAVGSDGILPVRAYLTGMTNRQLRAGVTLYTFWDSTENRFRILQIPTSLLGAMWLQFAQAVAENRRLGTCRWCGNPFEVSRKSSSADRQHCSDKCKSKAYRNRKERAIAMALDKTPEQIAEELGSDPETVKDWIGQGKTQAAISESRGEEK